MKKFQIKDFVRGWFIGPFKPSVFQTDCCEVAVKTYSAGDVELAHFHKIATEVTVVISGSIEMCGKNWNSGDIIVLSPGEVTEFRALTDAVNVVVKIPGANDDKYSAQEIIG